jgi:aldehyde dehydrogenase (NAD+)
VVGAALADVLASEIETFALQMARKIGKPVRFGRAEVEQGLHMLRTLAQRAVGRDVLSEDHESYGVGRQPYGVVAVITPWDNPLYIALGKIVPAILYGNAVLWKPAPEARTVSRRLLQSLIEADWPSGL